jgi:hypothetical protein
VVVEDGAMGVTVADAKLSHRKCSRRRSSRCGSAAPDSSTVTPLRRRQDLKWCAKLVMGGRISADESH